MASRGCCVHRSRLARGQCPVRLAFACSLALPWLVRGVDDNGHCGADGTSAGSCQRAAVGGGGGNELAALKERAFYETYASPETQARMVLDLPRTRAYRDALKAHGSALKGATVLDVGCGTGVLSVLAAQQGAARVFCVEATEMAMVAERVAADNGVADVVTVLQGRVEDVALPVAKVDCVLSEWMGYWALFEGMHRSVLWARDRYLRPGGLILPTTVALRLAFASPAAPPRGILSDAFRKPVLGVDMSALAPLLRGWDEFAHESALEAWRSGSYPEIAVVATGDLVTRGVTIAEFDLSTAAQADLERVRARLDAPATRPGHVDRAVGWFECGFGGGVTLDTGPSAPATHWQQMVFHLPTPVRVRAAGDRLRCDVDVRMVGEGGREVEVGLALTRPERRDKTFTVVIVPDTRKWAGAGS